MKLVSSTDDKFFTRSKFGAIWGTIYFQVADEEFFPEKGWTDMPVAFALTWLEALLGIEGGAKADQEVSFFDEPLEVHLSLRSPGKVKLDFLNKKILKISVFDSIHNLLENALDVAGHLLRSCKQKGWSNADTEALQALMQRGFRCLAESK